MEKNEKWQKVTKNLKKDKKYQTFCKESKFDKIFDKGQNA